MPTDRERRRQAARARLRRRRLLAVAGVAAAAAAVGVALTLAGSSPRRQIAARTTVSATTAPAPLTTSTAPPTTTVATTAVATTTTSPTTVTRPAVPPPVPAPGLLRRYRGVEMSVLPTRRHVVALTFDGGANDGAARSILRTLRRFGVSGTFFLTGRWVELYPSLARTIMQLYPVANHTYDHRQLTRLSDAKVSQEIEQGRATIRRITGRDPLPLFRFPYGATDTHLIDQANRLGYVSVRWSVDTLGWEGTKLHQTARSVAERVLAGLQPGEIVLMHLGSAPDGSTLDADALPTVIREVEKRGYRFTTLPG